MKTQLLVTTGLEKSWGADEEILFLGEWCKPYSKYAQWSKRNFTVIDYHWRDRDKLQRDHEYLNDMNEGFLEKLTIFLNQYHRTSHKKDYWRLIVGPWLLNYIPVLWDRWESCSSINSKSVRIETYSSNSHSSRQIAKDFSEAIRFHESDQWNHQIYLSLINFRDDLDIKQKNIDLDLSFPDLQPFYKFSLLRKILNFILKIIDFLLNLLPIQNRKIILFQSYFPRIFLFKLSMRLKILPGVNSILGQEINYPNASDRSKIGKIEPYFANDTSKEQFSRFLAENILADLPVSYLEGYKELLTVQSKLFNAENIFTANAHFACELFKVWSAEQKLKGSKLIISSHGGSLYPLNTVFDHQEKISDYRIVWGKAWMNKQTRMPANKINTKIKKYNQFGDISLIDYDGHKYSYRCASIPMGPLAIDGYKQKEKFINQLSPSTRNIFKVRPFPLGAWETADRYQDTFGAEIISSQPSLTSTILNSRLVICAYPQTTFSEAMYSGVPTMILYEEKFWEVQPIYKELIDILKATNIMHINPSSAARHVERIADNPLQWWNEPKTILARKKFNDLCLTIENDPIYSWTELFRAISSGGLVVR
ncbi:MAG: LIC12162 family protein [SAR86 cluster bacterium]|nr:LIC12162 family protein [SAR86 cluster bacterium]